MEATYRHGGGVSLLRSREDIDRFIDELLTAGWEYTAATVNAVDEATDAGPTHELVIGVDAKTGLGALRYSGDGTWWRQGEQTNPNGVVFAYFGTGTDFPADSEVPLTTVREAMSELLATGGQQPMCVR
ncbi:Imm1 family immunity protein [Saccharothrix longispora]|uniref:Imm1 family immunity protein n=1 Tax=Saccharothrix longispora TaxID=33920 RepID=UPI002905A1DB|nr:Imm1 family immunity protein [Saccharothrix longispora]